MSSPCDSCKGIYHGEIFCKVKREEENWILFEKYRPRGEKKHINKGSASPKCVTHSSVVHTVILVLLYTALNNTKCYLM